MSHKKRERDLFHEGALCALHVVFKNEGGDCAIYRDIVNNFGIKNLVNACEDWDEAVMVGLHNAAGISRTRFYEIRRAKEPQP